MPFPAFWVPNYHASTSGNYSLCMAIRCEIKFKKKHSRINCNIRYWANDFTDKTREVYLYQEASGCVFNFPSICLFSFPVNPQFLGKKHTRIVCQPARQAAETIIRSVSCSLQLRLKSNERKKFGDKMLKWTFRYYNFFSSERDFHSRNAAFNQDLIYQDRHNQLLNTINFVNGLNPGVSVVRIV